MHILCISGTINLEKNSDKGTDLWNCLRNETQSLEIIFWVIIFKIVILTDFLLHLILPRCARILYFKSINLIRAIIYYNIFVLSFFLSEFDSTWNQTISHQVANEWSVQNMPHNIWKQYCLYVSKPPSYALMRIILIVNSTIYYVSIFQALWCAFYIYYFI